MPWQIAVTTVAVVAVVLLPFVLLYIRRRWLTGQGGLFDCAYRVRDDAPGVGWVLGMARYRGEDLEWFRAFSFSLKPKVTFQRASTGFIHQRHPEGIEAVALFEASMIVTVRDRLTRRVHSLAMAPESVMGLMSWLESAPPGSHYLPTSADTPG
ncbi:DUF2550 domain-containing protein [Tessaracoccus flavus]|jgi:hypothetical protein|uniref:Uncharacterized protein n=1 Tax=Tessaracoccus flavus TaxID=1610493 RepID=A0A1Q2CEH8_9ACTN|nr:DUF2550 domain-containing protein [Tessaracoccus flavus]AQP44532.1 hypothetical protein RPIT_06655 [Tessaracoccus flavus]SDZ10331.1 Protein of unknown function [Tessaracoccus flavus]